MRIRRFVQVIDTHTAGEPTRIVTGGFPPIPGKTMEEKRIWLSENADELRKFLLQEPRGHPDMFGAIVSPPTNPQADFGLIFCDGGGYLKMCGHGTIGAVTALASLGWTQKDELVLDTPAGTVHCWIDRVEGEINSVTFRNVPSFYLGPIDKDGLRVEIAYGGNLFALVAAKEAGLSLNLDILPELITRGLEIRAWVNTRHAFHHPETGNPLAVELVEFYEETNPPRNVVVFGKGQVDRSPCGTGTCAKMAFLHAQGKLRVGEEYRHRSILDTEFVGRIASEIQVGKRIGIVPEVRGTAYITGIGSLVLTGDDPFPTGFQLLPT